MTTAPAYTLPTADGYDAAIAAGKRPTRRQIAAAEARDLNRRMNDLHGRGNWHLAVGGVVQQDAQK